MRQEKKSYQKWMSILALMLLLALAGFVVAGCGGGATKEEAGEEISKEAGEGATEEAGEEEGRTLTEQEKAQEDRVADEGDAAQLYTDNCGPCHGHDGSGVVGPAIMGSTQTAEQIQKKIEAGGEDMPAFKGGELTDEQIKVVSKYVKEELK